MDSLDILGNKTEQLRLIIPYLEKAAIQESELEGLPITTRTNVLLERYLRGWKTYLIKEQGKQTRLSTEGVWNYYQKLTQLN